MTNCTCQKCKEADLQQQQLAQEKLCSNICDVIFDDWHYECGDGCCDEYGINLIINGYLVTTDCGDTDSVIKVLELCGHTPNVVYTRNGEE